MLDETENFLLGTNVNEPVAVEIIVDFKNQNDIDGLILFLEESGFEITKDGTNKGKLLIDRDKHGGYSIITPALKPKDVKQLYSDLKYAIQKYAEMVRPNSVIELKHPHLLDLKHLVIVNNNIGARSQYADQVIDMLWEFQHSKDVHILDMQSSSFYEDLAEIFPKNYIFNGSTIPDPYSVATDRNIRFVRYGAQDPAYALSYTGVNRVKQISGYRNITPDGKNKIGFLFKYEPNASGQIYFSNAGLESNFDEVSGNNRTDETVINRFDNPCVGIYLMWAPVNVEDRFYIYRIDAKDPRYQILKEFYKPSNPNLTWGKRERFQTWIEEGEQHQTYVPVKNDDLEHMQSNVDKTVYQRNYKKQRIAEIEKLISDIGKEISDENFKDIINIGVPASMSFSTFKSNQTLIENSKQMLPVYEKKIQDIKAKIQEIQSEIASNDFLQQHNFVDLPKLMPELEKKKRELAVKQSNLNGISKDFDRFLDKKLTEYMQGDEFFTMTEIESVPLDIRKKVLLKYQENARYIKRKTSAQNLVNIYASASQEDKAEMFDILYDINKRVSKDFRKFLKKYAENVPSDEDKEVLSELFKGDNFFVKHTEKAKKLMALRMATINLKRRMQSENMGAVISNSEQNA